jgi:hypothetical protein
MIREEGKKRFFYHWNKRKMIKMENEKKLDVVSE